MLSLRGKMLRYLVFINVLGVFVSSINPGPQYPATKGAVWPKPLYQKVDDICFTFNPAHFEFKITGKSCKILEEAVERYSFTVRDAFRNRRKRRGRYSHTEQIHPNGPITELRINLRQPCEDYPYLGMIESYNLTIAPSSELTSTSIWGVLRGLESWSQLFYVDSNNFIINATYIIDEPQYPHRGLLVDTSRHYISLRNLYRTIDAMAMNKLNVLHWHIVDDQSFPYQSKMFPELSRLGAYTPAMVYSETDIKRLIEFARARGIRVLPEFDVPGHTRSWGEAYPGILTKCYDASGRVTGLGPMNPIHNVTYKLLHDLFLEVQSLFPEKYLHIGGDEVELACWRSNLELQNFMKAHNMTSVNELHALFMRNVIPLLDNRSLPIVWQEVFDEGVPLDTDTLIQVWKWTPVRDMISVLSAGHRLIYSSSWYLDHLKTGGDWEDFYKADPRQMVYEASKTLDLEKIVGGEACMWGEVVNNMNIISRVWPRASAVAERLWSPPVQSTIVPASTRCRLEEHACRMNARGIGAQPPNGPGFC